MGSHSAATEACVRCLLGVIPDVDRWSGGVPVLHSFYGSQKSPTDSDGRLIADVVAVIGSLDIVLGAIDR